MTMSDNELLLAISDMMDDKLDAKLKPIEKKLTNLETTLEENVIPRLQNVENTLEENVTPRLQKNRNISGERYYSAYAEHRILLRCHLRAVSKCR